jgi:hypothetical protein
MNRRNFLKASGAIALSPVLLPHQALAQAAAPHLALPPAGADGWISLLNGRDLTGWYSVLQKSGKDAPAAKKMVTVEQEMLHIMGSEVTDETYETGFLATNQEFENVRIRLEYKWGEKRFAPFTLAKRDNGLLYGLVGADKVWPTCVEFQIEEGDVGDCFMVGGVKGIQGGHGSGKFGGGISAATGWPKPGTQAPARPGQVPSEPVSGRMIKDGNFEDLNGWNVVEVIWQGDQAIQIVNGRAVNVVTKLQYPDPQNPGSFLPLTRGKIGVEIIDSEIWFRRIEVKSLV